MRRVWVIGTIGLRDVDGHCDCSDQILLIMLWNLEYPIDTKRFNTKCIDMKTSNFIIHYKIVKYHAVKHI